MCVCLIRVQSCMSSIVCVCVRTRLCVYCYIVSSGVCVCVLGRVRESVQHFLLCVCSADLLCVCIVHHGGAAVRGQGPGDAVGGFSGKCQVEKVGTRGQVDVLYVVDF